MNCPGCSKIIQHSPPSCEDCGAIQFNYDLWDGHDEEDNFAFVWRIVDQETSIYCDYLSIMTSPVHVAKGLLSKNQIRKYLKNKAFL